MRRHLRIVIAGAGPQTAPAEVVRGLGHEVCAVAPPELAAERAAEHRPDLLLVDLDGPAAASGVEAAEGGGVPVVCLVGGGAEAAADDLLARGRMAAPFAFVVKPVDGRQLRLSIDTVLFAQARTAGPGRRPAEPEHHAEIARIVLDTMDQPVLAADTRGRFLLANTAARAIVEGGDGARAADQAAVSRRYGLFEMDGRTPWKPEDLPLTRAIRGEATDDVLVRVRRPGESAANVFMNVSGRPLRDAGGGLIGGVVVMRDVTAIKRQGQRTQRLIARMDQRQRLMHAVLDSMQEGVVALDKSGRRLLVNRAARRMLPLEDPRAPLEDRARQIRLYRPDDDTPLPMEDLPIRRALAGESFTDVKLAMRNPRLPHEMLISIGGGPLRNRSGDVWAGVVVLHDVTESERGRIELRQTAAKLRERAQLMNTIFQTMSDGVVVVDGNGRFTLFNQSAQRLVGIGASDTAPDEWTQHYGLFHVDRVTPFAEGDLPLVRAMGGESVDDVEIFVRNLGMREGNFISVDARPLRNEAGEVSGGVAVIRDLSQNIAAREAFVSGRIEVLDTVLHNIGNAMNSVTVGAGTLHAELRDSRLVRRLSALAGAIAAQGDDPVPWLRDDPQGRQALPFLAALAGDLAAQNDRLLQTADRVRDRLRHIEGIIRTQRTLPAGQAQRQVVELKQQIADAVKVLQETLAKRGVRVEVDCAQGPDWIRIHESRFQQMLVNLVRNAMEALDERAAAGGFEGGGEEPWIRIASRLDPEFVVIDVADNGIGIDPARRRSIFSAGYTTKKAGSGLGLHSAANFVIGMGGRITPLSAGVGRGAMLRVMLRRSTTLPLPAPGAGGDGGRVPTPAAGTRADGE